MCSGPWPDIDHNKPILVMPKCFWNIPILFWNQVAIKFTSSLISKFSFLFHLFFFSKLFIFNHFVTFSKPAGFIMSMQVWFEFVIFITKFTDSTLLFLLNLAGFIMSLQVCWEFVIYFTKFTDLSLSYLDSMLHFYVST